MALKRQLLTSMIVVAAIASVLFMTWTHFQNPWTRDGQVMANVVEIVPRVSGPIVALPLRDNQFVHKGDLLFAIDPRIYQASLDQARATLDQASDNVRALVEQVESARAGVKVAQAAIDQARSAIIQVDTEIFRDRAEYERQQQLLPKKATSQKSLERAKANYDQSVEARKSADASLAQSQANLLKSQAALAEAEARLGAAGGENPQLRQAMAALRQAELNMEFTQVRAPVSGYVTNLRLSIGSHVVANQPALALVDSDSFWVDGYFKENVLDGIRQGDPAAVTLMTYSGRPLKGYVDSIGWGISQKDGSTAGNMLPRVDPTFEWIRLAQRIPVRVHLVDVPQDIQLRVGTTCSVQIRKGSRDLHTGQSAKREP